jgi:1-acyl-sn-glycerol-3-phosphate acyltransferase
LKYLKFVVDVAVTIILWIYFTLGFVIFFSPVYAGAFFFSKNYRRAFQNLNHQFLAGFLWMLRTIVPGLTIEIDECITSLHSCVIVSNHRSYIDPLILIALFEKHSTIVRSDFFRMPIFGRIINAAGYIPSEAHGNLASLLIQRVEDMNNYVADGGVLFIFPEGTRSRNGRIGSFNKGAFKIAKRCNAPIEVLCITNTEKLFAPGSFLFNTCVENKIEVRWIGRIYSVDGSRISIDAFMIEAREMMDKHLAIHLN